MGRYPAVKLVDARELAREAQRKVAHGGDPVVEKRATRDVLTFGELADVYIDTYATTPADKPQMNTLRQSSRPQSSSAFVLHKHVCICRLRSAS